MLGDADLSCGLKHLEGARLEKADEQLSFCLVFLTCMTKKHRAGMGALQPGAGVGTDAWNHRVREEN